MIIITSLHTVFQSKTNDSRVIIHFQLTTSTTTTDDVDDDDKKIIILCN